MILQLLLVSASALLCQAYPDGAPVAACSDLLPQHGVNPQNSDPPYHIHTTAGDDNTSLTVHIHNMTEGVTYRGFMIQGRDSDGNIIGTFDTGDDHQAIDCTYQDSTVTHVNNDDKMMVMANWEIPAGFTGEVTFGGTVVQTYEVFWAGIESDPVAVSNPATSRVAEGGLRHRREHARKMGHKHRDLNHKHREHSKHAQKMRGHRRGPRFLGKLHGRRH